MTSQEKKRALLEYAKMDRHIDTLVADRDRWMMRATKITSSFDGMPRSSDPSDRVHSAVEQICEIDSKINEEINGLIETRDVIEAAIEKIPDMNQRTVLRRKYILGETLEQIAEAMNYSWRSIAGIHGMALSALSDEDCMVLHKQID